jgi:hypothetical protein
MVSIFVFLFCAVLVGAKSCCDKHAMYAANSLPYEVVFNNGTITFERPETVTGASFDDLA